MISKDTLREADNEGLEYLAEYIINDIDNYIHEFALLVISKQKDFIAVVDKLNNDIYAFNDEPTAIDYALDCAIEYAKL